MNFFDNLTNFIKKKIKINVSENELSNFVTFLKNSGFTGKLIDELKIIYQSNSNLDAVRNFLKTKINDNFYSARSSYFIVGEAGSGKTKYILKILPNIKNIIYVGSNVHKNETRSSLDNYCLEHQIPCIFTENYNFSNVIKNINQYKDINDNFSIFIDTSYKTTKEDIEATKLFLTNNSFNNKIIRILDTTRELSEIPVPDSIFLSKIVHNHVLGSFFSFAFDNKISILNDDLDFNNIIPDNFETLI